MKVKNDDIIKTRHKGLIITEFVDEKKFLLVKPWQITQEGRIIGLHDNK